MCRLTDERERGWWERGRERGREEGREGGTGGRTKRGREGENE